MPAASSIRILVADDQPDVLKALRLLLKGEGYTIETVASPRAALQALKEHATQLALIDLNYSRDTTSGQEGLELLEQIRAHDPDLPIVVMTAWGSVELAVDAMRRGAKDFIQKPWENARLLAIVRTQLELARVVANQRHLEAENALLRGENLPALIAESPAMRPVLELIERVGPSDANVLITGESGTGKEVVAQTLHRISPRAARPLISVNIGALAEGVFESELFGHVKGAFTGANTDRIGRFELANLGTLFLDEVANITLPQQARLLRVLESGEFERVGSSKLRQVDVRLFSATNAPLRESVRAGDFREDLLFRLNTVEIPLPPLRDRGDDVLLLAQYFLDRAAQRYHRELKGFDASAIDSLRRHNWPGNVRELDHVIQRAALLARGDQISAPGLGLAARGADSPKLEDMSLDEVEQYLIKKTLERCEGNVAEAAKELGLSRSAMYRRLQKHGL